jgi:hypothetical protein
MGPLGKRHASTSIGSQFISSESVEIRILQSSYSGYCTVWDVDSAVKYATQEIRQVSREHRVKHTHAV